MPSPFPGMDPYLEHPELWSGVHHWLIIRIAEFLNPQINPKYRVAVKVRVFETIVTQSLLVGIPDLTIKTSKAGVKTNQNNVAVAELSPQPVRINLPIPETIKQGYLEVKEVATGEVVTVIELLSPVNKKPGEGRNSYLNKRQKILGSSPNFVELDLLKSGHKMPMDSNGIKSDYRIVVSRGNIRPQADLYAFNLTDKIPPFPLPLQPEDSEPIINLQDLVNQVYDHAAYDLVINYQQDPYPPVSEQSQIWLDNLLKQKQLRS
jgi:hypothetical protein